MLEPNFPLPKSDGDSFDITSPEVQMNPIKYAAQCAGYASWLSAHIGDLKASIQELTHKLEIAESGLVANSSLPRWKYELTRLEDKNYRDISSSLSQSKAKLVKATQLQKSVDYWLECIRQMHMAKLSELKHATD